MQLKPGAQSAESVQLEAQAVAPHRYGAQARIAPAAPHTPRPLQVRAGVSVLTAQLEPTQTVFIGCRRQAPVPLHPPARPQVSAPWAGHWLRGSWALATGPQVPANPARLQEKQKSVQALPQQTPSTQNPDVHCPVRPHATPAASLAAHRPSPQ